MPTIISLWFPRESDGLKNVSEFSLLKFRRSISKDPKQGFKISAPHMVTYILVSWVSVTKEQMLCRLLICHCTYSLMTLVIALIYTASFSLPEAIEMGKTGWVKMQVCPHSELICLGWSWGPLGVSCGLSQVWSAPGCWFCRAPQRRGEH